MQLRPLAFSVALTLAVAPRSAGADVEGNARVTVFHEPSKSHDGLSVIHPQGDVSAGLGEHVRISAGYEVDVVSGATPAVFGPREGPDAVTGATAFSDERHAVRGGFELASRAASLQAAYSYGWEKDYVSHTLSATAQGDLVEKNFTLALAYARNFDSVCDAANSDAQSLLDLRALPTSEHCFQKDAIDVATRKVAIDTLEPSLSWTVTPRLLLQAGFTLQVLDGFQSNPYRSVLIGSQHRTPQEHLPSYRQRYAAFVRGNYALPALRGSLSLMGRGYRDTWGLEAGTAELGINKYLAPSILLQVRGRYHRQTAAVFYRTGQEYRSLGPAGEYWTGDRELAPMTTILAGARAAYVRVPPPTPSVLKDLEIALRFDYLLYQLDPGAPNSDRPLALVGQLGISARF